LFANLAQLRTLEVALAEVLSIQSLSSRAALYARPWAKMAREARPQRRARKLAGFNNKYPKTGAGTMTINEYVATTARAFMAAEIAMAAVNCGVADATAITALDPIGSEA
jgi:hypothetical protein